MMELHLERDGEDFIKVNALCVATRIRVGVQIYKKNSKTANIQPSQTLYLKLFSNFALNIG